MGFPFDTQSWEGASGAIFMGVGTGAPGILSIIAIGVCIGALVWGYVKETRKYRPHK